MVHLLLWNLHPQRRSLGVRKACQPRSRQLPLSLFRPAILRARLVPALDLERPVPGDGVAVLQQRHKEAMLLITERRQVRILCLSRFSEKAYEKRMSAENVEKLLDAVGCKPDWFEISFVC